MLAKHASKIIVSLFLFIFVLFVFFYQLHSVSKAKNRVAEHVSVVEPLLWNYDQSYNDYLAFAAETNSYASIEVYDTNGYVSDRIKGPVPTWYEQWLITAKLIPLYEFQVDIKHSGKILGTLTVNWRCDTIYTYLYVAICLVLITTGILLFLNLNLSHGKLKTQNILLNQSRGKIEKQNLELQHEITSRNRAEDALRLSHERFLAVLNSISAFIYVADMKTHEILFMNRFMINSFQRDMTGELCWEAFRGKSEPCSDCSNKQLIDENGKPTDICTWQGKDPITGKWHLNNDRAIEWTDGRFVRLQIATDITNLKKMEEDLRQSHKMEAIGTMAGGIAHDFNNILAAILGYADMAKDDIPDFSPAKHQIKQVIKAGNRAKDLVHHILTFSRMSSPKQNHISVDFSSVVKEALSFQRSVIPTTIEIKTDIDKTGGQIYGDPTQIHQIILNFCTNASHAMEAEGGSLGISLHKIELSETDLTSEPNLQSGPYIRLSVNDTGIGMAPELIEKIFDPYFSTKGVGKGSGMGLAVVHGIVKGHGGMITVDSKPGKGSTFNVFFPWIEKTISEDNEKTEEIITGTERILFVDDEEMLADIGKSLLEKLGYSVTAKSDSTEALALFQNDPDHFDLVITDQTMPGLTGSELAKQLLQIRPDIPIILCTGYSSMVDEMKTQKIGIREYAMKPVKQAVIAGLIRKVLGR